jgi:hypothetical protein
VAREIFTFGDPRPQFARLGVKATLTFDSGRQEWDVYEVSPRDFKLLCDDPDDEAWNKGECGWRYAEGSNLGSVDKRYRVNGHYLVGWSGEQGSYDGNELGRYPFKNLREFLENIVGCTTTRNVSACLVCLATQNGMKVSQLLARYGI